jgi:hypothetical protein
VRSRVRDEGRCETIRATGGARQVEGPASNGSNVPNPNGVAQTRVRHERRRVGPLSDSLRQREGCARLKLHAFCRYAMVIAVEERILNRHRTQGATRPAGMIQFIPRPDHTLVPKSAGSGSRSRAARALRREFGFAANRPRSGPTRASPPDPSRTFQLLDIARRQQGLRAFTWSSNRSVRIEFVCQDWPEQNPALAVKLHHLKLLVDAPIIRCG